MWPAKWRWGKRAAAVFIPAMTAQKPCPAETPQGPRMGQHASGGAAVSSPTVSKPASSAKEGFEDLELQENRIAHADSIDDPGGVDGCGGADSCAGEPASAAASGANRGVKRITSNTAESSAVGRGPSSEIFDHQADDKGFIGAEIESLRCSPDVALCQSAAFPFLDNVPHTTYKGHAKTTI